MTSIRKLISLFLMICIFCSSFGTTIVYAETELPWPSGPDTACGGAILIDAKTGTVLYEKNSHERYYPASITKIMTALLAIEHSNLDDIVTYSRNAIFSIEPGSNHIALNPGEELSVRNSLYALMLASANEVANGLAEHVSGSMEAFAQLMTSRAAELGALNTNFVNANGLHNDNHYTTCYDMAMIAKAAFDNPVFCEIDATTFYSIPATNLQPEIRHINMGHKMLRKNQNEYYEGCIGGKTGYTVAARNTLVTYAQRGDLTLIAVVMNSEHTQYQDTKALLDFGFANFKTINIAENDTDFKLPPDSRLDMLSQDNSTEPFLSLDKSSSVILPLDADFSTLTSSVSYEKSADKPDTTSANISYYYGDLLVGKASLDISTRASATFQFPEKEETATPSQNEKNFPIPIGLMIGLGGGMLAVAVFVFWWIPKDSPRNRKMRERRGLVRKKPKLHF